MTESIPPKCVLSTANRDTLNKPRVQARPARAGLIPWGHVLELLSPARLSRSSIPLSESAPTSCSISASRSSGHLLNKVNGINFIELDH